MNEATDKALAEYEQAQSIGQHSDAVFHEIAAIAWGANTLLLGFILEVPCDSPNQRLVIVAAIIGIVISVYVPFVLRLIKVGQPIAYAVCREIEKELQLPHRLNTRIYEKYPARWGQAAVWVITVFFVLSWGGVIWNASHCLSNSSAVQREVAGATSPAQPPPTSSGVSTIHLDVVNTGIQVLLLAGLVWYTVETRRIRKTSQKQFALGQDQVEATLRPCISLSTAARAGEDAILAVDGTDSTVVVRCPEGLVQIENIGVGPAINVRYEFQAVDPQNNLAHPTGYVAGVSVSGTFLIPVARALLVGHDFNCVFDYESVAHRKYRTKVTLKNLVIINLRFESLPEQKGA